MNKTIYPLMADMLANCFGTRRIDMRNSDLALKGEFDASKKSKRAKRRSKKTDDESAFHYIAYVPIEGKVWELDGLHQQPLCIGRFFAAVQRVA